MATPCSGVKASICEGESDESQEITIRAGDLVASRHQPVMGKRHRKRCDNGSGGGYQHPDRRGAFNCSGHHQAGTEGSGNFDYNIMYVTGPITAASVEGATVVLTGTATVTGLGAGTNKRFTVTADRGGPGAKVVLLVSGQTFVETLLEGSITFQSGG